eukprot:6485604-Amphidinium_carterae.1
MPTGFDGRIAGVPSLENLKGQLETARAKKRKSTATSASSAGLPFAPPVALAVPVSILYVDTSDEFDLLADEVLASQFQNLTKDEVVDADMSVGVESRWTGWLMLLQKVFLKRRSMTWSTQVRLRYELRALLRLAAGVGMCWCPWGAASLDTSCSILVKNCMPHSVCSSTQLLVSATLSTLIAKQEKPSVQRHGNDRDRVHPTMSLVELHCMPDRDLHPILHNMFAV